MGFSRAATEAISSSVAAPGFRRVPLAVLLASSIFFLPAVGHPLLFRLFLAFYSSDHFTVITAVKNISDKMFHSCFSSGVVIKAEELLPKSASLSLFAVRPACRTAADTTVRTGNSRGASFTKCFACKFNTSLMILPSFFLQTQSFNIITRDKITFVLMVTTRAAGLSFRR